MDYATFYERFGASARTKNITTLLRRLRRGRGLNHRTWHLPARSALPREFIRLCPWEIEYLYVVARRAKLGIIETGRFNGGSCFLMACAAPDVPIHSIDIAPKDDALLRRLFQDNGVGQNVDLIVGDSQKTTYPQIGQVDLLFIDGDHSYDGCKNDLANWYPHLVGNGHLILHDCYLGKWGVQDAVADMMASHPELLVVQSPFIGSFYWNYPTGSLAQRPEGQPGWF